MDMKKVYISGPLTGVKEIEKMKRLYEDVGKVASKYFDSVYIPHLGGTDPIKDPQVSAREVWKTDHREVASSDMLIAYVGMPSLGVGAELEIARITTSDIILFWFKGELVGRMTRGNPAVSSMIEAEDEKDLLVQLEKVLKERVVSD